jgi:Ca2+/Na+ antiporter
MLPIFKIVQTFHLSDFEVGAPIQSQRKDELYITLVQIVQIFTTESTMSRYSFISLADSICLFLTGVMLYPLYNSTSEDIQWDRTTAYYIVLLLTAVIRVFRLWSIGKTAESDEDELLIMEQNEIFDKPSRRTFSIISLLILVGCAIVYHTVGISDTRTLMLVFVVAEAVILSSGTPKDKSI